MRRVALDVSSAIDPRPSGVARYIQGLVAGLERRDDLDLTLLCRGSRWRRGDPRSHFPHSRLVRWYDWRPTRGFDLVHAPDLRLPRRPSTPLVVTIHDLSALDRTDHATRKFVEKKREQLARVGRFASGVITHTEVMRRDLIARADIPAEGIESVPLWPALPRGGEPLPTSDDRSGLLLIGGPSARKGSERIAEFLSAYDRAQSRSPESARSRETITWCGSAPENAAREFFASLAPRVRDRIEWLGHIDDATLDRRLAGARAFVQLSDTEGFGIPLLESAVRQTPVFVWRSATAEEVLPASAAFWLGGSDHAEQLAAFFDREERARRVETATREGSAATRERTIEGTIAVYERVLRRERASVAAE